MRMGSQFSGESVTRSEPCRICRSATGTKIGVTDYWDLKTSDVVRCEQCGLIQLDPMLTDGETAEGCLAYYVEESLRSGSAEQFKNCERNFRRGVLFGYKLKSRKIVPRHVLELGPGSGYFAAGLQFVFPETEVTVMDINPDVLRLNHEQHGFKTIAGVADQMNPGLAGCFDLVIARDIMEHVSDISAMLKNVSACLKPGGAFHFITPNGREDVWKHYLTARFTGKPSELLINHVNYFDGSGLKILLEQNELFPVQYFTFTFKTTRRGLGWKMNRKLMSPVSVKRQSAEFSREKVHHLQQVSYNKAEILGKWYIRPGAKWITRLFALLHHFTMIRISPVHNIGHEIEGLFLKKQS